MKCSRHVNFQGKRVFVFDWDGTILDSMPMKSKNFVQAFKTVFPENIKPVSADSVAEHYLRLSGHPRKYIFYELLKSFHLEPDQILFDRFNSEFETLNKHNLINTKLFPDAVDLLITLNEARRQIFVSSSVPPKELNDLADKILPASIRRYISFLLGTLDGFAKGADHLQWIISETGSTRDQILVVGDDIADYELSSAAGVDCILVDRKNMLRKVTFDTVSDLYQLRDGVKNEI
jgi:phosphoglycolate phosphatase-like HAD superfamily hydrolase